MKNNVGLSNSNMETIKNIFEHIYKNWNIILPKGKIEKRENGFIQKDGWLIQFCFGIEDGKEYMDYYSSHRMAGDAHERIYENGERKDLSYFLIGYAIDKDDPEQTKINEEKYYEHNRRTAKELINKGFNKFTINMALETGIDKNN
jgi:hypothetical protein